MSTDPNFPRRDAPPLPSEAGADETYVPEAEVVSDASKGSKPNGAKANGSGSDGGGTSGAKSEDEIKKHDPEKFGSFTLPPDFLKEALSQPLPRAKEEDLAHDTLAPYRKGGEVHRQVLEEGSAYPGEVEPITVPAAPRAKMKSRAEAERSKSKRKYVPVFVVLGLIGCFAIGGMLGLFERQDGKIEVEAVSPKEDGSAEAARTQASTSESTSPASVAESAEGSDEDQVEAVGAKSGDTQAQDAARQPEPPRAVTRPQPKESEEDASPSGKSPKPQGSTPAATPDDLSRTKPVFGGK